MPSPAPVREAIDWSVLGERLSSAQAGGERLKLILGEAARSLGAVRASYSRDLTGDCSEPELGDGRAEGGETVELPLPEARGRVEFEGVVDPALLDPALRTLLVAEARAYELGERLKRERFEGNYRGVEIEALYDVGLAIASTLDLDELAEEILMRAVALLDARRGAFYRTDGGGFRLDKTLGGDALPAVEPDLARRAVTQVEGELDLLPGAEYLMAVPVGSSETTRGLLVVADKESREGVGPFEEADRRTLAMFANQAAIALENAYLYQQALEKERLEREGELAATIQQELLPGMAPDLAGFEIVGWNEAARAVGGDYYNYFELDSGRMLVVLGDVTGKGMPAALLVSTLDSALRLLIGHGVGGLDLIRALNRHIGRLTGSNTFITLVAAELDPESGGVDLVSAGHNPILVRTAAGTVRYDSTGLPLGLFEDADYRGHAFGLEAGDVMCLYSDGITEAAAATGEEFGLGRLETLIEGAAAADSMEGLAGRVRRDTRSFAGSDALGDDQTLILVARR